MKLNTVTQSHANEIKRKNDNRFREHFKQIFASHNTRYDFKIFWGSMHAPDPPSGSPLQGSPDSSIGD